MKNVSAIGRWLDNYRDGGQEWLTALKLEAGGDWGQWESLIGTVLAVSTSDTGIPKGIEDVVAGLFERADFRGQTEMDMRMLGGEIAADGAAAAYVSMTGRTTKARQQLSSTVEWLLSIDERPLDWRKWGWRGRVWSVAEHLMHLAYWIDDAGVAEAVLAKTWMPGGRSTLAWNDVPKAWGPRTAEWAGFAFWRYWWGRRLNHIGREELDLNRVLQHALLERISRSVGGVPLISFFSMSHALVFGSGSGAGSGQYRAVVRRLLEIEPRSWKEPDR